MKEKVGGLEAKCDQYHSYITELREMIQSVKILQGPSQRDTWEVFSTSCQVERPDISRFPGLSLTQSVVFSWDHTHQVCLALVLLWLPSFPCDHALFTLLQTTCIVMKTLLSRRVTNSAG